ncbi:MAG: hypothetical protein H7X86_06400 [Gorillibacterium sp.]|nr:hypothetical protein [Gorillibacterium sp.]
MINQDESIRAHEDVENIAKSGQINEEGTRVAHLLEELICRLDYLEREIRQHSAPANAQYYITVEHMQVDRPVLEQLTFQLDSLDISELSGSLNLGNNFGTGESGKGKGIGSGSGKGEDKQDVPLENPTGLEKKGKNDAVTKQGEASAFAGTSKVDISKQSSSEASKPINKVFSQKDISPKGVHTSLTGLQPVEMRDVLRTGTGFKFTLGHKEG